MQEIKKHFAQKIPFYKQTNTQNFNVKTTLKNKLKIKQNINKLSKYYQLKH